MTPRQSRVTFTPSTEPGRVVSVSGTHPDLPLFQDLLGVLSWPYLTHLAHCAAREIGYGHELAGFDYDDDPDEDDEPFEGVKIHGAFRDETAVVSRAEMNAILADLFEVAMAHGAHPEASWWPEFVADARQVAARTDRPLD